MINLKLRVLHYKSNFLNYSETFICRLINHHHAFEPVGMGYRRRSLVPDCPLFTPPTQGFKNGINTICFHLNLCLPFYLHTIRAVSPHVIHAHFGFDGYRMIQPSWKTDTPLVVSFHGSDVTKLPAEFDWKRRYRKLAHHGNAFTAVSNRMKQQLIDLGFPRERIFVVRCGLDLEAFYFQKKYNPEAPIMMVGRMVEKKGFQFALEAIKLLQAQNKKYNLDLYGDGPLRKKLEQQSQKMRIDDLVTFHGPQPNKRIRQAIQSHSMLLVPSVTAKNGDQEGLPITLLEAMASGLPVIASRHSAIPEAVEDGSTGLLVEEKNAQMLLEAILELKTSKLNPDSMRKNARKLVERKFEIGQMVQKVESIYHSVI